MQALVYFIFFCAMFCDFLIDLFSLPSNIRFLPEACSLIVILYTLVAGTRDRFRFVAPKYWIVACALGLVILCGIINGDPGAGPLISGMRFYFRAAPLFLLPAVLRTSEKQLETQLKVILFFAFLQLPLAVYQRWLVISQGRFSGDSVTGSLSDSGILSMFLICVALVLTGMLLKHRIGKLKYLVIFLILLFPTTINETKVTVIFMPAGLLVTLLVGADPGKRLRYAFVAIGLLVVFGAIFVPVYNKMEEADPRHIDIVEFYTSQKRLSYYLATPEKDSKETGLGGNTSARRADALTIPFQYLSKDPVKLAFGLGLGNASPSLTSKSFEGAYFPLFHNLLVISFAYFLLEFGVLGLILIGMLLWMVFWDSVAVARLDDGLTGALAAGWTGVVVIFVIATVYTTFHFHTSVTFLYWYFAGVICARRMALLYPPAPSRTGAPAAVG
jgi:hypothetical protein